jgi:hypothetical protein
MIVEEKRIARIFRIRFECGEEIIEGLTRLAREKSIREASLHLYGALLGGRMITGFRSADGFDVNRAPIGTHTEYIGHGTLTWPDASPEALGEGQEWDGPQPYVHIHFAASGPAGKSTEEVRVGHLSTGEAKATFVDLIEYE